MPATKKPKSKLRFTARHIRAALKKGRGINTAAAGILGVDEKTIRNYLKRWPKVAEYAASLNAVEIGRSVMTVLDIRDDESEDGNTRLRAAGLHLAAKAPNEGWGLQHHTISGDPDQPIPVIVAWPKQKKVEA